MRYSELKESTFSIGPVYHGTNSEFTQFSLDAIGSNLGFDSDGFFFSSDLDIAKTYGSRIIIAHLHIKNPLTLEDASSRLPVSYDEEYEENGATLTEYYDNYKTRIINLAKSLGHDGVLFEDFGEQLAVVFDTNQIKIEV